MTADNLAVWRRMEEVNLILHSSVYLKWLCLFQLGLADGIVQKHSSASPGEEGSMVET